MLLPVLGEPELAEVRGIFDRNKTSFGCSALVPSPASGLRLSGLRLVDRLTFRRFFTMLLLSTQLLLPCLLSDLTSACVSFAELFGAQSP